MKEPRVDDFPPELLLEEENINDDTYKRNPTPKREKNWV